MVDGAHVVDNHPWHGLQERYGRSQLAPGEHRFDLWLAQSDAEPRLQLLYTPTGRLEHLPVPGRWFLPRAGFKFSPNRLTPRFSLTEGQWVRALLLRLKFQLANPFVWKFPMAKLKVLARVLRSQETS